MRARDAIPGAVPGATGRALQGAGEVGGARRARSSEPTPAGGGGERAVGGAGHPRARKSDRAEAGKCAEGRGALRRSPRASKQPPSRLTSGSIPLPQPTPLGASVPEPGRGRDPGAQASSPDAPGTDAAGPGAAHLGPRDRERRQRAPWSRAPGAAPPRRGVLLPRFSRTPSRARRCETGPGCRCRSLCCRRRRQRTPRGGWKPV